MHCYTFKYFLNHKDLLILNQFYNYLSKYIAYMVNKDILHLEQSKEYLIFG